ncbi:hypothetical protein B0O99DRAFT_649333 [Bisporella sp. PMI_857]|nr:hypothetical protein B0O99DRAFT_649333 [Bisporella sp. PMI_857]
MAPKKKEQQKMSLGAFLTDEKMGSWADEMEDIPVYSRTNYGGAPRTTYSSTTGTYGGTGGYSVREELPLPDKPPYTVHLGNLSFDATVGDVTDFFAGCECTNVRIIEDKLENKPKGFGYAEFATLDGIKSALTLNGTQFQGRNIRISVADPHTNDLSAKDRDRPDARELTDWSRKGPLPDLPGRGDRRASDRGGFGGDFERKERTPYAGAEGDGKVRDFGNWERKGPLPSLPQTERGPRDGGRPRTNEGPKAEGFRDRRASPAAWGEGRQQPGSQDGGSRPPRREFQERPVPDRTPTAAEQDNQWRAKMKPDAPAAKSPVPSRDGSEAPSSPAPGNAAPVPSTRPKLNLAKRTVTDVPDQPSPTTSVTGSNKPNPFGGASAVDTAARERQVEEARAAAIAEKKAAEEKAKADRTEAAKHQAAEAEQQKTAEGEKKIEILQRPEGEDVGKSESGNQNGTAPDKPRELVARPKPSDTGAWRRPSQGPPGPRDDGPPRGPRGGRGGRGGRGDGQGRGPRHFDEGRGGRQNSNGRVSSPAVPAPTSATIVEADPDAPADDGWSTVAKPKKNNRGGR